MAARPVTGVIPSGSFFPVIDFHIHPVRYEKYIPETAEFLEKMQHQKLEELQERFRTSEDLEAHLRMEGVDYGVVLADLSVRSVGLCPNEYVSELCRGSAVLIPFANVNPHLVTRPDKELERCVKELGMRGVKLYPVYQDFYPNDPMMYPLYEKACELGIPVMIHTGSSVFRGSRLKYGDPVFVDDIAVDFPELTILLVHGGRGAWYNTAFLLARIHENVYLEVAGLPPQRLLHYFPELDKIPDKVVFGSDFPAGPGIRGNIESIMALPLDYEFRRKILGLNAARILGIEVP